MKFWCWLTMGHQWTFRAIKDSEDGKMRSITLWERKCCARCGTPNPNYDFPFRGANRQQEK